MWPWLITLGFQIAILFFLKKERERRLRDDKRREIATLKNIETLIKSIDHFGHELQIKLDCIDTSTKIQVNNSEKIMEELDKIKQCALKMTEITKNTFMDN